MIILSGRALGRIREACSVARSLQPAVIVVEDVDLIAEQREARPGEQPLLFQLLNEMDGLNSGADVTFLLTTNRADLLEPALAARPGRVDLAAELPLPDADARRQLIRLYQGHLVLDLTRPEAVIERTEGVTAAFLKELLRKAALLACEDDDSDSDGPIRVTDVHLDAALDQLLDSRNQLTRVLLGGDQPRAVGHAASGRLWSAGSWAGASAAADSCLARPAKLAYRSRHPNRAAHAPTPGRRGAIMTACHGESSPRLWSSSV